MGSFKFPSESFKTKYFFFILLKVILISRYQFRETTFTKSIWHSKYSLESLPSKKWAQILTNLTHPTTLQASTLESIYLNDRIPTFPFRKVLIQTNKGFNTYLWPWLVYSVVIPNRNLCYGYNFGAISKLLHVRLL